MRERFPPPPSAEGAPPPIPPPCSLSPQGAAGRRGPAERGAVQAAGGVGAEGAARRGGPGPGAFPRPAAPGGGRARRAGAAGLPLPPAVGFLSARPPKRARLAGEGRAGGGPGGRRGPGACGGRASLPLRRAVTRCPVTRCPALQPASQLAADEAGAVPFVFAAIVKDAAFRIWGVDAFAAARLRKESDGEGTASWTGKAAELRSLCSQYCWEALRRSRHRRAPVPPAVVRN